MDNNHKEQNDAIAIIGMAAKFADADNINEFFDNLLIGLDSVSECPDSRKKDIEKYLDFHNVEKDDRHYRQASFLKNIDGFDYEFFRISPKEAEIMDPHQRLLLQVSYQAIEDSGYDVDILNGSKIGIYTGFPTEYSCKAYQNMIMETNPELANDSFSGNLVSMLPARLSYYLNLHGPALLVDTSCSSSLSAVHLACQAIHTNDCEIAIANGVNIFTVPLINDVVNSIGIVAADGKARPFDEAGSGVGQGEGIGAIVLKPLNQALKDSDHIYAVILSSAINQDGKTIGITAPSMAAQESVIVHAWERAKIDPETIKYIEAHGTATKLGDPTEISGINRAFKRYTSKKQFCGVGSVKSNIGHTIGAAGIASVIKAAMALEKNCIPPTIHFVKPNQRIQFHDTAVYVHDRLNYFPSASVKRCGISSFGISGTNCHIVMEEAPQYKKPYSFELPNNYIFTLSARNEEALYRIATAYKHYLIRLKNSDMYDICYTANIGRKDFEYRAAFIIKDIDDLLESIESFIQKEPKDNIYISFGMSPKKQEQKHKKSMLQNSENTILMFPHIIAEQYINGEKIDWTAYYQGIEGRRVSLPPYQFHEQRCWFTINEAIKKTEAKKDFFYSPIWRSLDDTSSSFPKCKDERWLIFSDQSQRTQEVISILRNNENYVMEVIFDAKFEKKQNASYSVGNTLSDYESIMQEALNRGINKILVTVSVYSQEQSEKKPDSAFQEANMDGLLSAFYLSKTLLHKSFKDLQIIYIVNNAYYVSRNETYLAPVNAALIGYIKAQKWEKPSVDFRCIDVDKYTDAKTISHELKRKNPKFLLAYRENICYSQEITLLNVDSEQIDFHDQGVYLIIGGNGRIGRQVSNHLSKCKNPHIVIISRSKLPSHDQWKSYIDTGEDPFIIETIKNYQSFEKNGARITHYAADISNREQISFVIDKIRSEFGPIRGVFHCAVDDSNLPITQLSEDQFTLSLKAKINGTTILDELTKDDPIEFFILFSSAMTLVSGVGAGCYTAANSFLETYAQKGRMRGRPILAISWPEWKNVGLDQRYMNDEDKSIFMKIDPDIAIDTLFNLLGSTQNHIIVGNINVKSSVYELIDYLPFNFSRDIELVLRAAKKQPNVLRDNKDVQIKLTGRKNNVYGIVETAIATAYHIVLGYEKVDIRDNFFEIGGDSISAAKIGVLLEEENIELKGPDILKYQTIEQLAQYLERTKTN